MKKYMGIFLAALFLVSCSNKEIRSTVKKEDNISTLRDYNTYKENLAPKRRVVIGKVKNYTRFGTQRTDSITKDILISEFANSGRFNVLEREDLDSVMEELAFSNSLGEKSILAKQKFLDTDFVVVGSVTKYELNTTGSKSLFSKSKEQRAEAVIELKVIDVLKYGEVLREKGLNLLSAPGNDLVATTALAAAKCHIVLFTTGRGNPYGGYVPTVKISTNSELYNRKRKWIDFDAGRLVSEDISMEDLTEEFIEYIIEVINGEKTNNEKNKFQEIAIFKSGVTL